MNSLRAAIAATVLMLPAGAMAQDAVPATPAPAAQGVAPVPGAPPVRPPPPIPAVVSEPDMNGLAPPPPTHTPSPPPAAPEVAAPDAVPASSRPGGKMLPPPPGLPPGTPQLKADPSVPVALDGRINYPVIFDWRYTTDPDNHVHISIPPDWETTVGEDPGTFMISSPSKDYKPGSAACSITEAHAKGVSDEDQADVDKEMYSRVFIGKKQIDSLTGFRLLSAEFGKHSGLLAYYASFTGRESGAGPAIYYTLDVVRTKYQIYLNCAIHDNLRQGLPAMIARWQDMVMAVMYSVVVFD